MDHPFPREVEYVLFDTIEVLRPKLTKCASWEEASQAAEALDKEFAAKLGQNTIVYFYCSIYLVDFWERHKYLKVLPVVIHCEL